MWAQGRITVLTPTDPGVPAMSFHPSKSLRPAAALLVVFALATIALALPRSADAAPKCGGNSVIWVVNSKQVCLKTAGIKPGHAAIESAGRLALWFAEASKPVRGSKLKIPKKLRAASPKAAAAAAKLVAKTASMGGKKRLKLRNKSAGIAAAASAGPVVERMNVPGETITIEGGIKVISHGEARAYADGTVKVEAYVDMTKDGYTVRYQPLISSESSLVPEVECPTNEGLLTIDYTSTVGGTLMILKGKSVLGAMTEKTTNTVHAHGHVGRDARLHDVDATATTKLEHYERGYQSIVSMTGSFSIPREGNPVSTGPISSDIKLRQAGATAAQERAAEKAAAATVAASSQIVSGLGSQAEVTRWRMMQDEDKWYSLPGRCADVNYDPTSTAKLAAGKSVEVKGRVTAHSGGEAAGEFTSVVVSHGTFTTTKAQTDPGSPALFQATGASPDADKHTVATEVIASSRAGRAQWGWYAEDEIDLPKKISGVISASSSAPGTSDYFHSWVVYTLDQVYVSDGGYISAWYKLTTADQDEVQQEIGSGCRWVGKGSGGNIEDGDIELRKPPGGEWSHAVMYDVEIPDTTFVPTDCGASPPPPFTGNLVGFVNMAMLGGGFEPVGDGFHLDAVRTYKDPASGRSTVASWSMEPGDPQ
jgi:hypothetical protein